MDALTTKQKNQMYDELSDLVIRYGKDKTAKRMIKAFCHQVKQVETTHELSCMEFALKSLKYLMLITFPTK